MTRERIAFLLALTSCTLAVAQTPPSAAPAPNAASAGAAAPAPSPAAEPPTQALPPEHVPVLALSVNPAMHVRTGEIVHAVISADAPLGDDVTVSEQSFAPFEVQKKRARVEPPKGNRQRFVFELDLLALTPGTDPVPAIELRVVTKNGLVGSVKTEPRPYEVRSWLANEPNAQPKRETKPISVEQDNYIPIYIAGTLLAIAIIAGLTLLVSRYLRNRKKKLAPPPPPRPPWEVAVEKLGALRKQKQAMIEAGQGGLFVDQVSDVVREYLGARHGFDGLETTSDEMLTLLSHRNAGMGFIHEVGQFLSRCDLVKFAKVEPDQDEADLIFSKAQDLVHFSDPGRAQNAVGPGPLPAAHSDSTRPDPTRPDPTPKERKEP